MTWYARNFHIEKEIASPCLTDIILYLNLNSYLALANTDIRALNTLAGYVYNNPINKKYPKTGLRLNSLMLD